MALVRCEDRCQLFVRCRIPENSCGALVSSTVDLLSINGDFGNEGDGTHGYASGTGYDYVSGSDFGSSFDVFVLVVHVPC
uniref:ZP domain-containing protein n=1 Tax=Angiostrongylus cantonensis TaxID=6313 RepID=A0A0K0D3S0_ANGCA